MRGSISEVQRSFDLITASSTIQSGSASESRMWHNGAMVQGSNQADNSRVIVRKNQEENQEDNSRVKSDTPEHEFARSITELGLHGQVSAATVTVTVLLHRSYCSRLCCRLFTT